MLTVESITKKYNDKEALKGVTLKFDNGVYGLLGPNGAGKSTLMNIITGNVRPTSGCVKYNNININTMGADYRKLLGYAPQQQGLYDSFSGRHFLCYMATLKGIKKKKMRAEIERVLSYVNMTSAANRAIGGYSGGMKQRILIAQAILGNPKVIILDEPTAGLDPKERVRIREKIRDLAENRIVIISTHVVSDIQSIAKEIVLLQNGDVVDIDSVNELCSKYDAADDLEEVYMKIFGEDADNAKTINI